MLQCETFSILFLYEEEDNFEFSYGAWGSYLFIQSPFLKILSCLAPMHASLCKRKQKLSRGREKKMNPFITKWVPFHLPYTGADLGLFKLVVTTDVFFSNLQHKIKIKWFLCVKKIASSFFSNSWNQRFYS